MVINRAELLSVALNMVKCIRYNREWHRRTKIPLKWIEGAGHNSNTDKPEMINSLLEEFFSNIL